MNREDPSGYGRNANGKDQAYQKLVRYTKKKMTLAVLPLFAPVAPCVDTWRAGKSKLPIKAFQDGFGPMVGLDESAGPEMKEKQEKETGA